MQKQVDFKIHDAIAETKKALKASNQPVNRDTILNVLIGFYGYNIKQIEGLKLWDAKLAMYY